MVCEVESLNKVCKGFNEEKERKTKQTDCCLLVRVCREEECEEGQEEGHRKSRRESE